LAHRPPTTSVEAFLQRVAKALASQPWLDSLSVALADVVPLLDASGTWQVVDGTGAALRLTGDEHWPLLAFSGGNPLSMVGEWRDGALRPLAMADCEHYVLYANAS
jgi:hypothetical protein